MYPAGYSGKPAFDIRVLNHWDNLDGTIERGYAGRSLWKWEDLTDSVSARYREYARANASVGINGTVLNNVNASPEILSADYLQRCGNWPTCSVLMASRCTFRSILLRR